MSNATARVELRPFIWNLRSEGEISDEEVRNKRMTSPLKEFGPIILCPHIRANQITCIEIWANQLQVKLHWIQPIKKTNDDSEHVFAIVKVISI